MRASNLRHFAVAAAAVALVACGARQNRAAAAAPQESELGRGAPSETGSGAPSETGSGAPSETANAPAGTADAGRADNAPPKADDAATDQAALPRPRSPAPPKIVPASVLESLRTAGDRVIRPPHSVELKLRRSNRDLIVVLMKMCVSKRGVPISLETIRPSHFPRYDHRIFDAMRKWRFRPFEVDGKPVPVCAMVTFLYRQQQ